MKNIFWGRFVLILPFFILGGFPIKNSMANKEKNCHFVYDPNLVFQEDFLCMEEANQLFQKGIGCNTSGKNIEKFHCRQEGRFWRFSCCHDYNLSDYINSPHKKERLLT